ncbi:hypothetical protein FK216_01165 [Moraxellaceae bacterium AER2_44_116]|nr:HEAT repeat domain-containing protein [Moraxellaceae bacterium]TQC99882.1 hypothetical protein FK216_01165 [Moraxellaceae bacterium AER2_44_116]
MTTQLSLHYRGRISALHCHGAQAAFVSTHPEQQATALYRLGVGQSPITLEIDALPCGATALVGQQDDLWLAGQNGHLYHASLSQGMVNVINNAFFTVDRQTSPILGLALLAERHIVVLQAQQLSLFDLHNQTIVQQLTLTDTATTLATSNDGRWLVVGDHKGQVTSYQFDHQLLTLSAQAHIHKGAVTALSFEPLQQRFFSAGDDKKLYSTHVQGELQALDKGRNSNHTGTIYSIISGFERTFTGANDQSIKAWPDAGGQPLTYKKNLPKITQLGLIYYQDKPCLLMVGEDQSLRFLELNDEGKPIDVNLMIRDGYYWAQQELQHKDPQRLTQALNLLSAYDDLNALELLAKQLKAEQDKTSRLDIVNRLCASKHAKASVFLEACLTDKTHDVIRLAAFASLSERAEDSPDPLRHCLKALETPYLDIGELALKQLAQKAQIYRQAEQHIVASLQHSHRVIRHLALSLLEQLAPANDPKASLQALQSQHNDLQRAALIRLYQRKLLNHMEVQRTVVLLQDHSDALVRQTALWVAILARPVLAQVLKQADALWTRPLADLENFKLLVLEEELPLNSQANAPTLPKKTNDIFVTSITEATLTQEDYTPLLQGMASRHADICFNAAYGLAVLHDARAFGVLLLLAQETNDTIRMGVCKALANLKRPEAKMQLEILFNDPQAAVRDVAFSSYGQLETNALLWVTKGFSSKHQDLHARSLKVLLDQLGQLPADQQSSSITCLTSALNDVFEPIRQETVKACLNRSLAGNRVQTLQLLLSSQYQNVHQEVLNELMSHNKEDDALSLLVLLLNDAFSAIREQALKFALQEKKRFIAEHVLTHAINSRFVDIRRAALQYILDKPSTAFHALLPTLLEDSDRELRLAALNALVTLPDNTTALAHALLCHHEDIQVAAAQAFALRGDERAFSVLQRFATRAKPDNENLVAVWKNDVKTALAGLAALEDERVFAILVPHIQSKDPELAKAAATALPWSSTTSHSEQLALWLGDERSEVRAYSALALAILGDSNALIVLQDKAVIAILSAHERLAAMVCLQQVTPPALQEFFSKTTTAISSPFILFCHELLLHPDAPHLSSWALSINSSTVQLLSADILMRYQDLGSCWQYMAKWLIECHKSRQDDDNWQISVDELQALAAVMVYGIGKAKARAVLLLQNFDQLVPIKTWQLHYIAFSQRHQTALENAIIAAQPSLTTQPYHEHASQWRQLAFGAYIGLLRLQNPQLNSSQQLGHNLLAMRHLAFLAQQDHALRDSACHSLMPLLNHQQQALRQLAFEILQQLGLSTERVGQVAITSVQQDIVKQGLELLIAYYPTQQAHALLHSLIQTSSAILAVEGWRLLCQQQGLLVTAPLALASYYLPLRQQCVAELAGIYNEAVTPQLLLTACRNDHRPTAVAAADLLAQHQHVDVLPALKQLLSDSIDSNEQARLIRCFRRLSGVEAARWLTDYLDNPQLRIDIGTVYDTIAHYRCPEVVEPLLLRLEHYPVQTARIVKTVLTISGYDQRIHDYDDTFADNRCLSEQHQRYDDVLIRLFQTLIHRQEYKLAHSLLTAMAWMKSPHVDNALLAALPKMTIDYVADVVIAISRRAYKRQGNIQGLLDALRHKNTDIQFLAAEGLAKKGHLHGNSILLAAIDYQTNADYRQRAVLALGESGDERALDKLLALAEDQGHFLQAVAIEAIGHMGQGDKAEQILRLLKSTLKQASNNMIDRVLNGFRWLNSLAAWQQICAYILRDDHHIDEDHKIHAISLLQYWDTPASRDLLLTLLREETEYAVVTATYNTACLLWQYPAHEASPVDDALLQGHYPLLNDGQSLTQVIRYAPTAHLLKLLVARQADVDTSVTEPIKQGLFQRQDYPTEAIEALLISNHWRMIAIVAELLPRMPVLTPSTTTALGDALTRGYQTWQRCESATPQYRRQPENLALLATSGRAVNTLLWAAIHHGYTHPVLSEILLNRDKSHLSYQVSLLRALLAQNSIPEMPYLALISALCDSAIPDLQQLANHVLAKHWPSSGLLAWQAFLTQPQQLARDFHPQLSAAASHGRSQAQALPALIAQHDIDTLAYLANQRQGDEWVRMGAIEGLGKMGLERAERHLQLLSQPQEDDEDIRKAAFRALRRSQRLRHATTSSLKSHVGDQV